MAFIVLCCIIGTNDDINRCFFVIMAGNNLSLLSGLLLTMRNMFAEGFRGFLGGLVDYVDLEVLRNDKVC